MANFVSKLSDANAEAAETQVWLDFALECRYLDSDAHGQLQASYTQVGGGLIKMLNDPRAWCGPASIREAEAAYDVDGDPYADLDGASST